MADAPQMDRPGVEVIQQFVATTPTILRPSLPACIVGPCVQVVEAVQDDGTLNPRSLVTVPARFTTPFVGEPYEYAALGGEDLVLSVNNSPSVAITLPGTNPTVRQIVDAVREEGIAGLVARIETSGDQQRVVLETSSAGDNASLRIDPTTGAAVLTAFDWGGGEVSSGSAGYNNHVRLDIQAPDYPNPRNISAADLKIDYDSVRVFISPGGGSPREVSRTSTFLTGGMAAVTVVDDGDGDSLSPYVAIANAAFDAGEDIAAVTGTVALAGVDFAGALEGRTLRLSLDGGPYQTVLFDGIAAAADIVDRINRVAGDGFATIDGDGYLRLEAFTDFGGHESSIRIDKAGSTADLAALGLAGAGGAFENTSVVTGDPYSPMAGDELWIDGVRAGLIVEVPTAFPDRLRLDTERLLTAAGSSWYIIAKGLNGAATAQRPGADLIVDANTGTVRIKQGLFYGPNGDQVTARGLPVYMAYDALRLDVTPAKRASDFNLVRVGRLTALEDELAPIDTQNPLALGMYFAMLNAPGLEVTGCGVDEVNDAAPTGTADAYARSFEFLESKEIYSVVPMTHSPDVGSIAATHANIMSEPANGLERIVLLNPMRPSRKSATLVASGARANVAGGGVNIVETGLANLGALLAAAGKPGPAYGIEDNLYIMFEGDSKHYLIASASGGTLTIEDGPLTDNEDGFYFDNGGTPIFDDMIVDRPFTVAIRGSALANRTDEAVAYADLGRGYRSKRVIVTVPDTVKTTLDGLEAAVPGYYAAAAIAGRKASKNPSQPLTEDSLAGFTGVVGSQERYSEPQLRIMAGGGLWILYQEAEGQPIRTRHQLTTDVSTLLARESSITDALDYAAKTLRSTFRNFVGRFNITTGLIEALNLVCDGVADFFLQSGLFASFNVVELKQNVDNPDELSVIVDIETLKPLNKIRVTMRVT